MAAPGLLGRWGFNEGTGGAGTAVADSSGSGNNGVLNGTFTWVPGVTFTTVNHAPDAPVLNAPTDDATGVASPATLDVSVSDRDADPLTVTYFGRRKAVAGPEFTLGGDSRHAALRRQSGARGHLHGPDELDRQQPGGEEHRLRLAPRRHRREQRPVHRSSGSAPTRASECSRRTTSPSGCHPGTTTRTAPASPPSTTSSSRRRGSSGSRGTAAISARKRGRSTV